MLLSKQELVNNIINELSDNSSESITPYHIRHNLLDILDSLPELFSDVDIKSKNAKTPDLRTSAFGQLAIERAGFPNYTTEDNSAFGFSSLRLNFRGARNTAVGSNSLRTNIYGNDNIAIGYESLSANVSGSGNISIGNFGITSNRTGDFNIAIGHGAGHYIGGDDNYKFYLGSSPVDSGVICDDPDGSTITPLLYGDLQNNILGINVNNLIDDSALHIGGSVTPSLTNSFSLGSSDYIWSRSYSSSIFFSSDRKMENGQDDYVYFNFSLSPESSGVLDFGSNAKPLSGIYTNNLFVNESATINNAEFINSSYYLNKTLNLAAKPAEVALDGGGSYSIYDFALEPIDNHLIPYLSLEEVNGAGLRVHVDSGDVFDFLLDTNNSDDVFWKSNISLDLGSGNYVKTDKVISGPEFSVDFGENLLSLKDSYFYLGEKAFGENNSLGFGNINFHDDNRIVSSYLCSNEFNTSISQRFFSDASGPESGGSYTGFEISYENRLTSILSNPSPSTFPGHIGFSIKSFSMFDSGKTPAHSLFLSRDNSTYIFAISDINEYDPEATADFNIADNCSLRVKSRSDDKTSTIFLDTGNRGEAQISCDEALRLGFGRIPPVTTTAGIGDINGFFNPKPLPTYKYQMSLHDTHLDLFNSVSGTQNFTVNIGDKENQSASIGLVHSDESPVSASGYAGLFAKSKNAEAQKSTLMFLDEAGNEFEVIRSPNNSVDGLLFTDRNNVAGGVDSFSNKATDSTSSENTGIGFESLKDVTTGSENTFYGSKSGKSITTGNNNIGLGYGCLLNNKTNHHNICIGTNELGSDVATDYNFLLGIDDDHILMKGVLGPENDVKKLELPQNGVLEIKNNTNSEYIKLNSNSIDVVDEGGSNFPDFSFDIKFSGNHSSTLLSLNHEDPNLTITPVYASQPGPFAELNGNLKLLGGICFSDGSFMDSSDSSRIDDLEESQTAQDQRLDSLFIEGVANVTINRPANINSPSTGAITTINSENIIVSNRDPNLTIKKGDYVIAIKIGLEYRPIWVSNEFNALVSF